MINGLTLTLVCLIGKCQQALNMDNGGDLISLLETLTDSVAARMCFFVLFFSSIYVYFLHKKGTFLT